MTQLWLAGSMNSSTAVLSLVFGYAIPGSLAAREVGLAADDEGLTVDGLLSRDG